MAALRSTSPARRQAGRNSGSSPTSMDSELAHFRQTDSNRFVPTDYAEVQSRWAQDHVVGAALAGLAAQVLETHFELPGFTPARLTIDLFRSPRRIPMTTSVELIRDG